MRVLGTPTQTEGLALRAVPLLYRGNDRMLSTQHTRGRSMVECAVKTE